MIHYFKNDIFTNPGDPIHILYSPVVSDTGAIELKESGKENLQDMIQSFLEETDINQIIQKYMNGDTEVLNQRKGSFGDFTSMPKTYAELLQIQIDAKTMFDHLPVEYKQKFDNDANKFFVKAGSEEWMEIMSPLMKVEQDKIESEEVKE